MMLPRCVLIYLALVALAFKVGLVLGEGEPPRESPAYQRELEHIRAMEYARAASRPPGGMYRDWGSGYGGHAWSSHSFTNGDRP